MNKRYANTLCVLMTCGFLAVFSSGCGDSFDDIISVEIPDRVALSELNNPAQATMLVNSVQGLFECALGSYIYANGMFTDELNIVQPLGGIYNFSFDQRDPRPSGGITGPYATSDCVAGGGVGPSGVYKPVSSARWFADNVLTKLEGWSDAQVTNRQALIARAATYAGYSLVLLGESMCSAALDGGPEMTPAELFQQAEIRFTKAIAAAQAAGVSDAMARVGRARTRMNLRNFSGAVEDARTVPSGFAAVATRIAGSDYTQNVVWATVTAATDRAISVGAAFRGVKWQGVADPRVPEAFVGMSLANLPYHNQLKYKTASASIPVARWEEAQLIIAEVQGGQDAINIINALHAKAGIPPFTASANDTEAIRTQVIEERRREFFLEGHRIGDFRRLGLPLVPAPGTAFPLGGVYGSAICYPLPDIERDNNPNI